MPRQGSEEPGAHEPGSAGHQPQKQGNHYPGAAKEVAPGEVVQPRTALVDILPPVWPRTEIRPPYSFWDLHVAVQDADEVEERVPRCLAACPPSGGGMIAVMAGVS